MSHPQSSWPPERPEQFTEWLREQGATPEEGADLLPAVRRLSEWQAPQPSPADTRRLLARLTPELHAHSPVRQAIREHCQQRVFWLLTTARAQVSLFGLGFWLVSALITLLGVVVVLRSGVLPIQEVALRACGPLLACLGTIIVFRGREKRVLELELVCLPSPLQLAIARLVIVLGYDLGLSLALSLMLWAGGAGQVLTLTLAWLMPLLLVAGLALLLSLLFPTQAAACLAYGIWLALLAISALSHLQGVLFAPAVSVLPGCIGLALLAFALVRMHTTMHHQLPHA